LNRAELEIPHAVRDDGLVAQASACVTFGMTGQKRLHTE
jgi:hypothetical protein